MPTSKKTQAQLRATQTRSLSLVPTSAGQGVGLGKGSRGSRVAGLKQRDHVLGQLCAYFAKYIVLPDVAIVVLACWVLASWLAELWDRFPHVAVTSSDKRCAKTRLMQLMQQVTRNSYNVTNLTAAVVYRLIKREREEKGIGPTLLVDEAQSLKRRGSEQSELIREFFNAAIDQDAIVMRCGGNRMDEVQEFPIYCPKALSLIGFLDGVLADRCIGIRIERKTKDEHVERCFMRDVKPEGEALREVLQQWAEQNGDAVHEAYGTVEPFQIENDRLAELLMPLQAVVMVVDVELLPALEEYATYIESTEGDRMSDGALLLNAVREIFSERTDPFIGSTALLTALYARPDEPWETWQNDKPMSSSALANVLKSYGIKPERQQRKVSGKNKTVHGYSRSSFTNAWQRYLPHAPNAPTT